MPGCYQHSFAAGLGPLHGHTAEYGPSLKKLLQVQFVNGLSLKKIIIIKIKERVQIRTEVEAVFLLLILLVIFLVS